MPRRRRRKIITLKYSGRAKRKVFRPYHQLEMRRTLAYIVLVIGIVIGIVAFYDLSYYYGYIVYPSSNFKLTLTQTSGGIGTSEHFQLLLLAGHLVSKSSNDNFSLSLGPTAHIMADTAPPTCTVSQSKGTPAVGETIELYANCTDDVGLSKIILYTDEQGIMQAINLYGSPADVNGTHANVVFHWNNPTLQSGTKINWKVVAFDLSGNIGESTTLSFSLGAPPDIRAPSVIITKITPESPTTASAVIFEVQVADDQNLSISQLLIKDKVVQTKNISGKFATVKFEWTPENVGDVLVKVVVSDAAGNKAEYNVTLFIRSAECDPKLKPADVVGECKNGIRTVKMYICDPTTGSWKPIEKYEKCAAPPILFLAVGVLALGLALIAALYLLKFKKKQLQGELHAA